MCKDEEGLTEKQRRFVEAYMGESAGNATDAARKAGYAGNENVLGKTGFDNLRKPKIAAAIAARREVDGFVAGREYRQAWLTSVMENEKHPIAARLKACELLGKTQGDFVVQEQAPMEGTFTVVIDDGGGQ